MKQVLLGLAILTVIAAPCAAQDPRGPFADVPTGRWAYQDADTLQKAGIILDEHIEVYGYTSRPMIWHEFAVNIARLLSQLNRPQFPRNDFESRLAASPPAVAALLDLMSHFKPDLIRLNIDTDIAQVRLAELAQTPSPPQASGPFSDVPTDHWAYLDIDTLLKAGIAFRSADGAEGFHRMPRPMTRQEFAVSTKVLLSEQFGPPSPRSADLATRLLASPSAISALQDLVRHLKPELTLLNVDVDTIQARLNEMGRMAMRPLADRPSPEVMTFHWAYEDTDTLQKAGIMLDAPDYGGSHRPMSRHDAAIKVARLLSQMSGPKSQRRTKLETRLLASPAAITALTDLTSNFQPELSRIDVDSDAVQLRLAEMARIVSRPLAAKPFPDVAHTHWSASAVETLRLNRIIAGYPQGSFTVTE